MTQKQSGMNSEIKQQKQQKVSSQVSIQTIQRKKQQLLRINADDSSVKHLIIFWTIFILIIIAISLLTMALPPTFEGYDNRRGTYQTNLINCQNPMGFNNESQVYCNNFSSTNPTAGLLLRDLSTKNQFISIYFNIQLLQKGHSYVQIQSKIEVSVYSLQIQHKDKNLIHFKKKKQIQKQSMDFSVKSYESQRIFDDNGIGIKGYRNVLGIQKLIEDQNTLIMIKFKQWPLQNIKKIYLDVIFSLIFQYVIVTANFTIYTILIRYILFAITLSTTIVYYIRLRIIPERLRTLQQKWIFYLSIFTVLFNDPLYAATILAPNGFTAFTSVAFIVNFLTFIMAFWMILVERILYQQGQKFQNVITKKKIAYFVILYISFFLIQIQIALLRLSDQPILPTDQLSSGRIAVFFGISLIIFLCGFVYITIQYCRNISKLFDKIWRNQIFLIFSCFYIILLSIVFVMNGFGVYQYIGDRILILFTIMNMYTIYLQFMYSITGLQVKKLENNNFLYGNQINSQHEIQTMFSNFGNQDVILDLDSQIDGNDILNRSQVNKASLNQAKQDYKLKKQKQIHQKTHLNDKQIITQINKNSNKMQRQQQLENKQQIQSEEEPSKKFETSQNQINFNAFDNKKQKDEKLIQNKSFGMFQLQG